MTHVRDETRKILGDIPKSANQKRLNSFN